MNTPAAGLKGQIVFVEYDDGTYYYGHYLNKYGRMYVEVPMADCDELAE